MAIFNSYVKLPEGICVHLWPFQETQREVAQMVKSVERVVVQPVMCGAQRGQCCVYRLFEELFAAT